MIDLLMLAACAVILARCICMVSKLSHRTWTGTRAHFAALAASYALLGGGALGTAMHLSFGPVLLLLAVAGGVLFDRRKPR